jgi:TRAP-type C4-dicarboxylate transport system permease small subunit
MRKTLNAIYEASAWVAALLMVGVLLMVLLSIVSRLLHFYVPGTDAYAGYAMAGAGFMALAHTLKRGEHIRVTLILGRLAGQARHRLELWALSVACVMSLLLSFFAWRLAWQSHVFHDISTGSDATPMWIPQILMGLGCTVLSLALLDEWWLEWRGQRAHSQGTGHE